MNYSKVQEKIEEERNSQLLEKEVKKQLKKEHEKEIKLANRKLPYEANTEAEIRDKLVHRKVITEIQRVVGQGLFDVRKEQKLTQPQIIELYNKDTGFNISDTCLSRWESGTRAIDLIFLLWFAEKYNVDLHELLTGEKRVSENEAVEELKNKIQELHDEFQKLHDKFQKLHDDSQRM